MKKQKVGPNEFNSSEVQLIEQLRQHPEMMARVQSIIEIARNETGPLKSADEVEELLIQEMRQLGNTSMREWAKQAEERVSQELKSLDASVRSRKKKR
jgi:non-homologous end joining protein Ku